MARRKTRVHLSTLFALFALIVSSVLLLLLSLVTTARTAAASVHVARGAQWVVSPTKLTNCNQCIVTLSNKSAIRSLTWFALDHHGVPGVSINPTGGSLPPKGQVSVNITVPTSTTCPANDTITFVVSGNSVDVSWNCTRTPKPSPTLTPTPAPVTPTPTATPSPTPSPTASSTPDTGLNPAVTATSTSTPARGAGQQNNGNPPASNSGGSSGGSGNNSLLSIFLSVVALLLGLSAFTLYLIPPENSSILTRLLALILPVSFLRRPPQP